MHSEPPEPTDLPDSLDDEIGPSVKDVADMLVERCQQLNIPVDSEMIHGFADAYGLTASILGRELALRSAARRRNLKKGKRAKVNKKSDKTKKPGKREKKNRLDLARQQQLIRDAEKNEEDLLQGFYAAGSEADI
jgi:hypothetical protein